ncbi:MAG: nitrite/sulfite reductase [Bacteroidetes bacterium]|nr:nitrite/sulfite reductase [Bacteroidota bacterium]MCL6099832.1 nitrite/sulfite reductase [Bacteroidota bacterium]
MKQLNIWQQMDINRGYNVYREIDEYEEIIKKLNAGEIHPERFKSHRLTFGTYGVRHHNEGIHMQRIKIPGGLILSQQLQRVAAITKLYAASGHAHLTTRQDIQLHYIDLENIPTVLRMLADAGITTKEACGNGVRNITASYLAGISPDEKFDVLPYAIFCTRYFLRHPLSSTLPRKFKITFSESEADNAYSRIHDIGAIPQIINNVKEIRGFKIYIGGGLGSVPMASQLITDFIPADEFYLLIEAALRIFHKYGTEERQNRNKARMKFLIARLGFDKFKKLVFDELNFLKQQRNIKDELDDYIENFPLSAPTKNGRIDGPQNPERLKIPAYNSLTGLNNDYWNLYEKDIIKQKQTNYVAVMIKPPLGNLTPDKLKALADFSDQYGAGYAVITPTQNILIPWVEKNFIYDAYNFLLQNKFFGKINNSTRDIVSCPGAYSCKLAITHPYNLAEYIGENIDNLAGIRLHISGCPNSCGQHHIGDIGLYGASLKVDGKLSPHYVVLIGGNIFSQRDRLAAVIGKVPAINAHLFIKDVKEFWINNKQGNEQFFEFVDRVGVDAFRRILVKYSEVGTELPEFYKEPGFEEEFKMEAESRGECAGSLLDLMAINLFDSIRNIYECEDDIKAENWKLVKEKCLDSLLKCAKMFVFLEGIEPQNEEEILDEFVSRISNKKWLCNDWSDIKDVFLKWKYSEVSKEAVLKLYNYTNGFVHDCDKSYLRLQPTLKIMECAKNNGDENEF